MTIGHGLTEGFLSTDEVREVVARGLAALDVSDTRVLVLIPDTPPTNGPESWSWSITRRIATESQTSAMPMPLLFDILNQELGPRVKALDFLVLPGTHAPMRDAQLSELIGRPVVGGHTGKNYIFNHLWDRTETFEMLGSISSYEVEQMTGGLLIDAIPVRLNRLILDYDHLLICGPLSPHAVAGFSGGAQYFFPGIAGPEMVQLLHWLGALLTSYDLIGMADTIARRIIHRAVEMIEQPHSLLAPVVLKSDVKDNHNVGIAGIFCGPTIETWSAATELSSKRHIVWLDQPVQRALAILPETYEDLWAGAKGMYTLEPVVADDGEVVLYAPHITEVSRMSRKLMEQIGYHCRDYFLAQWEKFGKFPGGILAHSTHLRGKGTYEAATGVETARIRVTLATGIPEEVCRRVNLDYLDPASIDLDTWRETPGALIVQDAGEMLYRLR